MMKWTNSCFPRAERGAALVLALLVMLVLSGLGLVAMHSTSEGTSLAGMHRLQGQSKSLSDSINQLGVMRSGRQASALDAQMKRRVAIDAEPGAMRRGGYVIFTTSFEEDPDDGFVGMGDGEIALQTQGGLFSRTDFVQTINEDNVTFRYIVRDPIMGPPVPGFSDEYCFIGVSVGSWANMDLGSTTDETARARARRAQALGRNISRAFIGPIECQ
jgi:hypothetical protein